MAGKTGLPEAVGDFLYALSLQGAPAPVREHRFCPGRRWRFDFAWPEVKVYVEIEGGTFVGGRHVRPLGYAKDCEKYNAATLAGWAGLRFTTDMIAKDPLGCASLVCALLSERGLELEEGGFPPPTEVGRNSAHPRAEQGKTRKSRRKEAEEKEEESI